jgi:hypothetical protein
MTGRDLKLHSGKRALAENGTITVFYRETDLLSDDTLFIEKIVNA